MAPAGKVTLAHDGLDVVVFAMTVKISWHPPVVPFESYYTRYQSVFSAS